MGPVPLRTEGVVSPIAIAADGVRLEGELALPAGARGIVLFAHGSGSSRHSPRNAFVARVLRDAGMGTLLFDLLTEDEDRDYGTRFDIPLLTSRLLAATRWSLRQTADGDIADRIFRRQYRGGGHPRRRRGNRNPRRRRRVARRPAGSCRSDGVCRGSPRRRC